MTVITVSSGKGVFFTKLVLGLAALAIVYHFLAGIVFFGFLIALNIAAIFFIVKMNVSEEAQRLGRRGNAIFGFMGMIAVQVIVFRNSNFVDVQDVNVYYVEAVRKKLVGYSILMVGVSLIFFVATYNIVRKVMEEYPVNPPPGLLYAFTATSSLGSSLLMYGFFFQYGAIYIDMSPNTFLEIRVKEAGVWLLIALFSMYFLMARLKFKSGEFATVYFFGKPVYSLTGHRDLMVPVFSAALHFITELVNQHPIGFSADFKVIRRDLPRQDSNEIVLALPGELKPVRLDGGDDGGGNLQVQALVSPRHKESGSGSDGQGPQQKGPSAEDSPPRIDLVLRGEGELGSTEQVAEETARVLLNALRDRSRPFPSKGHGPDTHS
jgi:hypothetical protein